MAVSLVTSGATAWDNITSPKTATVSWAAGDIIVVRAATEKGETVADLPTATGLTFTQEADEGSGSNAECDATIFAATAGGAGSGVTLSMTRSGPSTGFFGFHWSVWSGASGVTGGTGNINESTTNLTTGAGDAVVFILADFNATTPFTRVPATGSGTATEQVEGFFTQYSVYAADWVNTTAGTAGYGITDYTSLTAASAFLVLTSGGPTIPVLDQARYRFGADDGTEASHTFTAAESTGVTLATGVPQLLRIQVDETAGVATTPRLAIQYKRTDEAATEWRNLTT